MTETTVETMTPRERLAAIVAAGVAAYQARWPDLGRAPVVDAKPVTDKTERKVRRRFKKSKSVADAEPVTDKTEPAQHVEKRQRVQSDVDCQASDETSPPQHIVLSQERQREICLNCSLAYCVGIGNRNCPIRIEQRAFFRRQDQRRDQRRRAAEGAAANSGSP